MGPVVGKRDRQYVLYPQYFDSQLSRGQGRRVPRAMAVKAPTATNVFHAARAAGFDPELDPEHHFPGQWYEGTGRVLISMDNVEGTKEGLIRVIARHLQQGAGKPRTPSSEERKGEA